ncbi:hypothetical protein J2S01_001274 [Pectinatus haikarae]|uniref:Uncharacterized protein n=1 Tax=Pectinatus haikarae TaxID=349096 RepID=A0ABT9Y6W9_9FIRM|nr:hypothetical protein [Pectinatus haikarae]
MPVRSAINDQQDILSARGRIHIPKAGASKKYLFYFSVRV